MDTGEAAKKEVHDAQFVHLQNALIVEWRSTPRTVLADGAPLDADRFYDTARAGLAQNETRGAYLVHRRHPRDYACDRCGAHPNQACTTVNGASTVAHASRARRYTDDEGPQLILAIRDDTAERQQYEAGDLLIGTPRSPGQHQLHRNVSASTSINGVVDERAVTAVATTANTAPHVQDRIDQALEASNLTRADLDAALNITTTNGKH